MKLSERAKRHFSRHWKFYVGLGIGTAMTVLYFLERSDEEGPTFVNVLGRQTNVVVTELERHGHPGYLVRCEETGGVFASQNRAAEACGISPANLSQHLNGKYESAGGLHFERLGEAK